MLLLLPFLTLSASAVYAVSTGSVGLYNLQADGLCTSPAFVDNAIIGPDSCNSFDPITVYSYIVNSRPTCTNGTEASFAIYSDGDCQTLYQIYPEGSGDDGTCLGLVAFQSAAFICNGISAEESGSGSSIASSNPSATPISTLSSTTPYAPTIPTSTLAAVPHFPPTTASASASAPSYYNSSFTGGSISPSITPFTGDAKTLQAGLAMGMLAVIAFLLL
ncbi:hypothetical protein MMC06_006883 [Schaereria dolodes]|nr:hypothetical protein [Schaereria dolodes]